MGSSNDQIYCVRRRISKIDLGGRERERGMCEFFEKQMDLVND